MVFEEFVPIEVLEVPDKAIEALRRNGIQTISDLQRSDFKWLADGWSLGVVSMRNIKQAMIKWPEFKRQNKETLKIFKYKPKR